MIAAPHRQRNGDGPRGRTWRRYLPMPTRWSN